MCMRLVQPEGKGKIQSLVLPFVVPNATSQIVRQPGPRVIELEEAYADIGGILAVPARTLSNQISRKEWGMSSPEEWEALCAWACTIVQTQ